MLPTVIGAQRGAVTSETAMSVVGRTSETASPEIAKATLTSGVATVMGLRGVKARLGAGMMRAIHQVSAPGTTAQIQEAIRQGKAM
jgi:hypothetical protein